MNIYATPGEIVAEERSLYSDLLAERYTGAGEIVEVGALVGASSICLADGLIRNINVSDKRKRIHVFDRFEVYPHLTQTFFPAHGIRGYSVGDNFLPEYARNTAACAEYLDVTKVDGFKLEWNHGPIEILFIDCAVSAVMYQHFIDVLYPHLTDGALIIDQDFFYQMAPWLPMKQELMSDVCELWTYVDSTHVAQFHKDDMPLPRIVDVPLETQRKLLLRHAARYSEDVAELIRIQIAVAEFMAGEVEAAKHRIDTISSRLLTGQAKYRARMARGVIYG